MKFLLLLMFLTLSKAEESLILDNNQFLIYNKVYHKARLAQYGASESKISAYEHALYPDQLWTMEPHPSKPGCYYIVNEVYPQYRIADYKHSIKVYSGSFYNDQLFKFVPSSRYPGFYYIYNCYYTNDRIAKYGSDSKKLSMYSGPLYDDQLWKLVPRFEASISSKVVFHFDNRQGSTDITQEITITKGVKRSSTQTIRSKITYTHSIEASLSAAIKIFEIGAKTSMQLQLELEATLTKHTEEHWSKTQKITFTVPAGKNMKVMQHVVKFAGQFSFDSCEFLSSIKTFESDTDEFEGDSEFL